MVSSREREKQKAAALKAATPQQITAQYQRAGVVQPVQPPVQQFSASRQAIQDRATSPIVPTPGADIFGATTKKPTETQFQSPGAKLSSGQIITPEMAKPVELGTSNVWGARAIKAEQLKPGTIKTRNDMVINNLLSQGVKTQEGIKQFLQQQPDFLKASPADQANTLNSLSLQMGISPTAIKPTEIKEDPLTRLETMQGWEKADIDAAFADLDSKMGQIKSQLDLWKPQASNWDQIMEKGGDMENFIQTSKDIVATNGKFNLDQVAQKLGWDKAKAQDFQIGLTRDPSQLAKYLKMDKLETEVSDPRKKQLAEYETQHQRNLADVETEMNRVTEDFNNKIDRTQKQIDIEVYNNKFISALTGASFSTAGSEGLKYVMELANNTMNDIRTSKDRTLTDITTQKIRLVEDWATLSDKIRASMQQNIESSKANFMAKVQSIQDKYGEFSTDTMQKVQEITRSFQKEYWNINDNAKKEAMDTFTMMNSIQNSLNDQNRLKMSYEQDFIKNMGQGIVSMSTTSSEFQSLRPLNKATVLNSMASMVAGALDSAFPGAGKANMVEIQQKIASGLTPAQIYTEISGSDTLAPLLNIAATGKYPEGFGISAPTTQQVGPQYTPVQETQIQTGLDALEIQYKDGTPGGQCGKFANNYAEKLGLGRIFKDPFTQKASFMNSKEAKVGSFIMRDSGAKLGDGSPAGHVGVVVGVNGDSILIKDSNGIVGKDGKGTETVTTRPVSLKRVLGQGGGFFDPTLAPTQQAQTQQNIDNLINSDPIYQQADNILSNLGELNKVPTTDQQRVTNAMQQIMQSRLSGIEDTNEQVIIRSSSYNKDPDVAGLQSLNKAFIVLDQIDNLQGYIKKNEGDMGPIEGYLRGKNPYDTDAQVMKGMLNSMVANVARGIFGEVGVLTDQDIERYMKTLPNQKMTKEVSEIVGELLKLNVQKTIMNTISGYAKGNRNVYNYLEDYREAKKYVENATQQSQEGGIQGATQTATGPDGKIYLVNGQWVDANGNPIQ